MTLRRRLDRLESMRAVTRERQISPARQLVEELFGRPIPEPDPARSPEERAAAGRRSLQLVQELFGPRSRSDGEPSG